MGDIPICPHCEDRHLELEECAPENLPRQARLDLFAAHAPVAEHYRDLVVPKSAITRPTLLESLAEFAWDYAEACEAERERRRR